MRRFSVSGMSCAACAARVEKAVSSVEGVESCSVNLLSATMDVNGHADDEKIIEAVTRAGYGARLGNDKKAINENKSGQNGEKIAVVRRLCSSAVILVLLMYISMGHVMWSMPLPRFLSSSPILLAGVELVLSLSVLIINGRFFVNGTRAVFKLSPNMDTLVALGSGVSFLYSTVLFVLMFFAAPSLRHHYLHQLYFESAAMILTLITVGKMLEERAKGKTTDAIKSLLSLAPKTANVIKAGKEIVIPASELLLEDEFVVRSGESVPTDAVIVDGEASILESALTGEPLPKEKCAGDAVFAATIVKNGFITCKAQKVVGDTAFDAIVRLVEEASSTKAPIAKLADKVSAVFVPVVMLISAFTFALQWVINGDLPFALARAISVLVISCPCALGLATPVAIMVGCGVGARLGVFFKNAEALELVGRARIIALDKTGTVTSGEVQLVELLCEAGVRRDELLSLAYSLEIGSEHPLARAVCRYAENEVKPLKLDGFKVYEGSGVSASVFGDEACFGNYKFVSARARISDGLLSNYERLASEGKTPVFLSRGGEAIGIIVFADTIREDSPSAVKELRSLGFRVAMITGDNGRTAKEVARSVGIDEVISEVLPSEKEAAIRTLSRDGGVIMVGDGINDAPALASAQVGMAIGGGTDIAIESANVVLMRDSLSDVALAVRLGRAVLRNIKENLFWAFLYNASCIPLAAGLFGLTLNPMLSAAAMSLSSFCVVTNALRLNLFYRKYRKEEVAENNDFSRKKEQKSMKITLKIEGMMCPHCEGRVRDVLSALDCVESAEVSHKDGTAVVTTAGECKTELLVDTVVAAGYKVLSAE